MNNLELVNEVSTRTGMAGKDIGRVIKEIVTVINEKLTKDEKVSITGLGSFGAKVRKSRKVFVNPRQKELGTKMTEEKIAPVFSAGKELKESVNK